MGIASETGAEVYGIMGLRFVTKKNVQLPLRGFRCCRGFTRTMTSITVLLKFYSWINISRKVAQRRLFTSSDHEVEIINCCPAARICTGA